MKKSSHPYWNIPTLVTVMVTILSMSLLEYFFSFPSAYLHPQKQQKIDIDRPTSPSGGFPKSSEVCSQEYTPVCGSDGRTYANPCLANQADTIPVSDGECEKGGSLSGTRVPSEVSPSVSSSDHSESIPPSGSGEDFSHTGKYLHYENTGFSYRFALPKYVYYKGLGAQAGANHVLVVGLSLSGAESIDTSAVQVYYYRSPSGNLPSGSRVDLPNGGALVVTGDTAQPKTQNIIDTIVASVKSTNP